MRISSQESVYRISSQTNSSSAGIRQPLNETQSSNSAASPRISISQSLTSFQSSLASSALDKAENSAVRKSPINEDGSFNPADMLTQSDLALFEKLTGYTIKDGMIADENGNAPPTGPDGTSPEMNLMLALSDIRVYGTTDADGQMQKVSGDITAKDIMEYLNQYRQDGPYDNPLLDKAREMIG